MTHTHVKSSLIAFSLIVSISFLQSCGQSASSTDNTTVNGDSLKNIAMQLIAMGMYCTFPEALTLIN